MAKRLRGLLVAIVASVAAAVPSAAVASSYTVTSSAASGAGSLRQAVLDANANPGPDEIVFADSVGPKVNAGAHDLGPIEITSNLAIKGPGAERLGIVNDGKPSSGGRIFNVARVANATITGVELLGVVIGDVGGGVILNRGSLELHDVTASYCLAFADSGSIAGGAIANVGSAAVLRVSDSKFSDNEALGQDGTPASGGAIYNDRGMLSLDHVTLRRNEAESNGGTDAVGGAVASDGGSVAITRSTLDGNNASARDAFAGGGAIFNSGELSIGSSTISSNFANGRSSGTRLTAGGGGIFNSRHAGEPGTFQIVNSTITGNFADVDGANGAGGGIGDGSGELLGAQSSIESTTLADNTARSSGANIYSRTRTLTVRSSIIAQPNGSDNCDLQPGEVASAGYNIDSGHNCYLRQTTDQLDTNPQLKSLRYNGGLTNTMALPPSSPAVDQGQAGPLTKDQRGEKRPVVYPDAPPIPPGGDASDVGAFELQRPTSGHHRRIKGSVRPGHAVAGERTCFRFKARRESGGPLAHARVKMGGKRAQTDTNGKATICKAFKRPGVRHPRIKKPGFQKERLRIRIR